MLGMNQALSIVHVVDSLEVGGLERVTVDLAKAQLAAGHQVCVFSINATQGLKPELLASGIDVIEGHKAGTLDRKVLSKLRELLRVRRADVVHAHNFVPNYYAALAKLMMRRSPVQVCTCHDMGMRLANRKLRWLFKWSLTQTQEVAMVGRQVYERYLNTGLVPAAHARPVLNGIPLAKFERTQAQRERARAELDLDADDVVIGCVGRLVPLKNHRLMIEVFPRLKERHPRLKLVIIGDGELMPALQAQVAAMGVGESVILAGQRSNVSALLPALDIFALPSQTEGVSIALLEACASGLAVLATRVGGNPEIIDDGGTGILIPADDNEALAVGLERLVSQPEWRRQLGSAAAAWVRANASDEALRKAYDDCYQKALAA